MSANLAPASPAAALQAPREFAILKAEAPNGTFTAEAFEETVKHYGSAIGASIPSNFEEFVNTVKRPASHRPKGCGDTLGLAAFDTTGEVRPLLFSHRQLRPDDVRIQIMYCGICHSDLHQVKNEWGGTSYPIVPGHEIVGVVTEVGSETTGFAVGDLAGVGCMVDSCGTCRSCTAGSEQYCTKGVIWTYNSRGSDGRMTMGGYSTQIVTKASFALRFPSSIPLAAGAPLLCAGATMWRPLKRHGLGEPGKRVGIVGLGGLGHVGVRLAKAMGAHVTVISTSESKRAEAVERLGADAFVSSKDAAQMAAVAGTLDGIIDTVSVKHDISAYCGLLTTGGVLCFVGLPEEPLELLTQTLIGNDCILSGSLIGSIAETQEMLDFCAAKGVVCDVEVVEADRVNEAFGRLAKNDVRYRFVIDIAGSLIHEKDQAAL